LSKAVFAEIDAIKRRFDELERKIDALPCVVAAMIAAAPQRRRKKLT
jgi:hypothetical protein